MPERRYPHADHEQVYETGNHVREEKQMDVFLTEEELEREKGLFEPQKDVYKPLKGRDYEINDFVPVGGDDPDRPKPPPSC